jgi:hypothetical protein
MRTTGRGRTDAGQILSLVPLPLGYGGVSTDYVVDRLSGYWVLPRILEIQPSTFARLRPVLGMEAWHVFIDPSV